MPELLRLRGKLKAQGGDEDGARESLQSSIELAETQGALSWRLRAEITLVMLSGKQGRKSALSALSQTLARFNEGLETADLQSAHRLLQA